MALPRIITEIAFGSKPTDSSYSWTQVGDTASPGTSYVREMSYDRGRQDELNQVQAGQGSVTLKDDTAAFDPSNASSPFYPNVKPVVPVRARAVNALSTSLSLTVSGNEITDVVRAAGVEGDGRAAPDLSVGIWANATNLCQNGGFETNTTGWADFVGTETLNRQAAVPVFGSIRLNVSTPGGTTYEGCQYGSVTVTASTRYTASAWVASASGSIPMRIQIVELTSLDAEVGRTTLTFTATGLWQRFQVDRLFGATGVKARIYITTTDGVAHTFLLDGVQLEAGHQATPYVHTDGGSATRGNARVQAPASMIDETQGWAAFRVRYGADSADVVADQYLLSWRDSAANQIGLWLNSATMVWRVIRLSGSLGPFADSAVQTFSVGDEATIVAAWTSVGVKVSVNGGAFITNNGSDAPILSATQFDIGSLAGASQLNMDVRWAAWGTGALTDADAATLYGFVGECPHNSALLWDQVSDLPKGVWLANDTTYEIPADVDLFQHYVEEWPRVRVGPYYAERTLSTTDAFKPLALASINGLGSVPEEFTGTRVGRILDYLSWPTLKRDIDTGRSIMAPTQFDPDGDDKALSHLLECADDEAGMFFVDGGGAAVFVSRDNLAIGGSEGTFADAANLAVGRYAYTNIVSTYADIYVFNEWRGSRADAGQDTQTQVAENTTSEATYWRRTKAVTLHSRNDADLLAAMQYRLAQYKDPKQRIQSITVKPGNDGNLWYVLLGLELGDVITIRETPPGGSASSVLYVVQHLSATLPADLADATFQLQLWPKPISLPQFFLSSATDGLLNTNKLAY